MNWRVWQRWTSNQDQPLAGSLSQPPEAPGIGDGLEYGLPVLLPDSLKATLTADQQEKLVKEAYASQTFRFQFDTPQRTAMDLPFMPPTEDPLKEWPYTTRRYVLEQTHAAHSRNPIANRACKYMAAFTVGEGFNLTCRNPEVQAILEAFIEDEDNDLRTYERQAVIDLMVDGEILLRLYEIKPDLNTPVDSKSTILIVAPQRPWECEWIRTEPGFFRRRLSYHFNYQMTSGDEPAASQQTKPEDVPASEIHHVAINRHSYELRGRPELYVALPWLRSYKEWLENRARQNHWRSAFLWLVRVNSTSPNTIASVGSRWARSPSPGSVSVESNQVEVEPMSNPVGAADAGEDGRQLKLMNAVAFGLPEYFLADGSNANLASSTSQQLPALMTFADYQRTLIEELWYPLFDRVVDLAVQQGRLPAMVTVCDAEGDPIPDMEPIPARDAYSVSYHPPVAPNIGTLATALDIAARNEWVDTETASTEMGFDYGIVKKRMEAQEKEEADKIAKGLKPPPIMPPSPDEDEEDSGQYPDSQSPADSPP